VPLRQFPCRLQDYTPLIPLLPTIGIEEFLVLTLQTCKLIGFTSQQLQQCINSGRASRPLTITTSSSITGKSCFARASSSLADNGSKAVHLAQSLQARCNVDLITYCRIIKTDTGTEIANTTIAGVDSNSDSDFFELPLCGYRLLRPLRIESIELGDRRAASHA